LQVSGPTSYGHGLDAFDAVPASFGPRTPASFGSVPQYNDPAGLPMPPPPTGAGMPADIALLARSGKMIQAIKLYRELTGAGLKEAKAAVEAATRGY